MSTLSFNGQTVDVDVADQAGLSIRQRAQEEIDNALTPWAKAQTTSNYNSLKANQAIAQRDGLPVPITYVAWGVNAQLVLMIQAFGPSAGDASQLFILTAVTVPAPVTAVPSLEIVTDLATEFPGLYEATGDSPAIAVGTQHAQDGKVYQKVGPVGTDPMSVYPDKGVYMWAPVGIAA